MGLEGVVVRVAQWIWVKLRLGLGQDIPEGDQRRGLVMKGLRLILLLLQLLTLMEVLTLLELLLWVKWLMMVVMVMVLVLPARQGGSR